MTTREFSEAFDILYNSYFSNPSFGYAGKYEFNEYEKSVILTKVLDDLVISLYSGKNSYGDRFEFTEELRRYLNPLVKTIELDSNTESNDTITNMSNVFILPEDLMFITYESVRLPESSNICLSGLSIEVIPTTLDDLHRVIKNPFKMPTSSRALRLDKGNNEVEILYPGTIDKYIVRYIAEPSPIILEDLQEGLKIKGISTKSECILPESLHKRILDNAVMFAIQSKASVATPTK